jgi:hypothetical protein
VDGSALAVTLASAACVPPSQTRTRDDPVRWAADDTAPNNVLFGQVDRVPRPDALATAAVASHPTTTNPQVATKIPRFHTV